MKIYMAGGFPQMGDTEKEKDLMNTILKISPSHKRLVTFWYKKYLDNMIGLKKEFSGDSET